MNAYTSPMGSLAQEELTRFSESIAAFLTERGASSAGIVCGCSPLIYAAVKGCLLAQVCYIPVDGDLPEKRREQIVSGADILLCDSAEFPGMAGCTDLREIVRLESGFAPPAENPAAPAYRIFTSGSTGEPKGIEVSRGNVGNFLRWFRGIPAVEELNPRRVLNQAALSFDLSVAGVYYSLESGCELIQLPRGKFGDLAGTFSCMRDSRAEMAVLTPGFAELCLCDSAFDSELLPELRLIFFCGEVLKPVTAAKLFRRFPGIRILNAYGPSEACCAVCASEITPEMTARQELPMGDMAHTTGALRISGRGEIVIAGASVARYCGTSQGGFRTSGGERRFFTGDGGYVSGGSLYFSGRLDRQVKLMGFRAEPEDVENNLMKLPGVLLAAVLPVSRGSRSGLYAKVVTDGTVTAQELRQGLSRIVPEYMIPGRIEITENIPLNNNGKLQRSVPNEY